MSLLRYRRGGQQQPLSHLPIRISEPITPEEKPPPHYRDHSVRRSACMDIFMKTEIERNLGVQPVTRIMKVSGLKAHDLVAISTEHLTHKMVARACKGRRLTTNVQTKIRNALNAVSDREYSIKELFTY